MWETKTKFLNHSFAKISAFCDAHLLYLIYKLFTGSAVSFYIMSDQSDSQNMSEEQVHMSEGTSPSSSSDEGSRSTPSNLPKAATRQRKKRTSDTEDEDYVAEEEATSKKVVLKKEYGSAAAIKPGMHKKAHARRVPTSKPRKAVPEETMKFTMESEEEDIGQCKKKKRARTTTARVIGKPSMRKDSSDEEEEEEEVAAPA